MLVSYEDIRLVIHNDKNYISTLTGKRQIHMLDEWSKCEIFNYTIEM